MSDPVSALSKRLTDAQVIESSHLTEFWDVMASDFRKPEDKKACAAANPRRTRAAACRACRCVRSACDYCACVACSRRGYSTRETGAGRERYGSQSYVMCVISSRVIRLYLL